MRDELQRQGFPRRPRQRRAGGSGRPAFEVRQIRRQRPESVFSHALAREVLERRDILVGEKLREAVAQKLGFNSANVDFSDGRVVSGNRSAPLAQAAVDGDLVAEDLIEYGDLSKTHQQSTFGAHFVELGVDLATAEIRVRRMLAVCAAGRILNPKTARSQVIGAMTMGVGAALMEELAVDRARGFFVNHDLAGYEVPVHADIPHQDVIMLDETDPMSSPMKAKGIGELGICGVAAAVANAVYNATGIRVRDYPITLDKLLDRLPEVG